MLQVVSLFNVQDLEVFFRLFVLLKHTFQPADSLFLRIDDVWLFVRLSDQNTVFSAEVVARQTLDCPRVLYGRIYEIRCDVELFCDRCWNFLFVDVFNPVLHDFGSKLTGKCTRVAEESGSHHAIAGDLTEIDFQTVN